MNAACFRLLLGLAVLGLAACSKPGVQAAGGDEMSMGDPKAKVTMIEYASVACPVCAHFNNEVFADFKKKYIDTGKVHYISREMLTGNPTLAASGFLMARCAGKDKYFQVTDAVYRAQDQIYEPGRESIRAGEGRDILVSIARSAGLSEDQFNRCITDEKSLKSLSERVEKYAKQDQVEATPTFFLNGKKFREGEVSMAELDAAIQPLLK
jgi:protein-disulfide isomerase